jgi:hypothetical protein
MDFSAGSLFASLIIGAIGAGLFLYGKRQQRMPQLIAGIVLSVYPYFVASVGWMVGIGAAVVAVLALAVRAGL